MLKVLVVEDNILMADIIEDFLASGGFDVCGVAHTVDDAVVLADLHNPDLGVFDFRLAEGGYGSQIRPRLKNHDNLGILFATGNRLTNELTRTDGEAYIQKPFMMEDLLQALRIVHEIKINGDISNFLFPKKFRLLENPVEDWRKSA